MEPARALLPLLLSIACGGETVTTTSSLTGQQDTVSVADDGLRYWPGASWRSTSPSKVGIDDAALRAIADKLGTGNYAGMHSFMVVRRGYVVAERYYGVNGSDVHTMQSVTKSVTSLLVGIAMDEGKLPGIDRPLLQFFPEYPAVANMDAAKQALTPRHLLTMRTGMSFYEEPYAGSPLQQLNDCGGCDWLKFILDRPMTQAPDLAWKYNSGAPIVLGGVLYAATGMAADEYARRKLFGPLGIDRVSWFKGNPNGLPHMGGGLALRTADLARIGYLVLRRGLWNGQQVVSQKWLDESTRRTTTSTERYFPRNTDYGMFWWLFPRNNVSGSDDYVIAGAGTGGQWLFIDTKNDLVVVFTGSLSFGTWPGVQIFFDEILPSVR